MRKETKRDGKRDEELNTNKSKKREMKKVNPMSKKEIVMSTSLLLFVFVPSL